MHAVGSREPRGGDAKKGQPAAEKDGLAAMAREERLASEEEGPALPPEPPWALEQPPRTLAAEQVAEVVADDGAGGGGRVTAGSESLPCEASTPAVIRAVSPGSGIPADSPPMSPASTR